MLEAKISHMNVMREFAKELEFEKAAELRDKIVKLREALLES